MTDDQHAVDGSTQRPVEPPVIELGPDEFKNHTEPETPEPTVGEAEANSTSKYFSPTLLPYVICAVIAAVVAILMLVVANAEGWLSANSSGNDILGQKISKMEIGVNQTQLQIGQLSAAIDEFKRNSSDGAANIAGLQESIRGAAEDIKSVLGSVEELRKSVATLEQERQAQSGELSSLREQVEKMQAGKSSQASEPQSPVASNSKVQSDALASGLIHVQTAAAEGKPFNTELTALRELLPNAEGLDAASQFAANGVASRPDLLAQLKEIAQTAAVSAEDSTASQGPAALWSTFKKKVSTIVKIRKLDEATWLDSANRAIKQIEQGDFSGGVDEIKTTEGSAPDRLRQWIEAAGQRVKLDVAIETLSASVMKEISRRT